MALGMSISQLAQNGIAGVEKLALDFFDMLEFQGVSRKTKNAIGALAQGLFYAGLTAIVIDELAKNRKFESYPSPVTYSNESLFIPAPTGRELAYSIRQRQHLIGTKSFK